ncbi:MAG: DNA cytosine methyltransferase, partial [Candidatus Atribacteria bacterium]|nr:DNA cytosine methyltransferase [Candidatus Atribacteria bacterium]
MPSSTSGTKGLRNRVVDRPFNILSLCAGVGGLDLGLRIAVPTARVVCHVEREGYCAEVLAARMEEEGLGTVPCWSDLRTFDGRPWRGVVDCLTAGFPCPPVSCAGRR